jgi:hypothetical protein
MKQESLAAAKKAVAMELLFWSARVERGAVGGGGAALLEWSPY